MQNIPTNTKPIPEDLIQSFIFPLEGDESDTFTEFIPIGRLVDTKGFHALVYWRAALMQYEFILATYALDGSPVSHAIVGGIRQDKEGMLHSVAVIHDDFTITIAEGLAQPAVDDIALAGNAHTYRMIIGQDGMITYETHEEKEET